LSGLGFSSKEAADAIDLLAGELAESGGSPDLSVLLRRSIHLLGRTR
jgi:hypothetical protein